MSCAGGRLAGAHDHGASAPPGRPLRSWRRCRSPGSSLHHVDDTCDKLVGSAQPDTIADKRDADLRKQIADCDRRLDRYRSVLDEGRDVATVAKWTPRWKGLPPSDRPGVEADTEASRSEELDHLVAAHLAGVGVKKLADLFGIHRARVHHTLKWKGVLRPRGIRPEDLAEAIRVYEDG